MHGEMGSEANKESLVVTPMNIPLRNGIDQDIHKVGKYKQHLQRKQADALKGFEASGY